MCSLEVYIKSFGGQKGGSLEPPRTPPAYGPDSSSCPMSSSSNTGAWATMARYYFTEAGYNRNDDDIKHRRLLWKTATRMRAYFRGVLIFIGC